MTNVATTPTASAMGELPRARVMILWLLAGAALLIGIGSPPVTRTQEARVLETARQMLGSGVQGWLIPHLNGEPRLKKPPLAYWLAATAFSIGDVSEGVGRVPFAIAGWLTLMLVYRFAREAFDQRIALLACATLLGSLTFFRFMRLAETDALATFFITLAVYALWRSRTDSRVRWLHLAAAATAMVILSKGAPAVFVGVFLLALSWLERRADLLRRFITRGALLTLLVLAVPWFIYVHLHQGGGVFIAELRNSGTGGDHFDWPWVYIPWLLRAAAPWVAFLPFVLVSRDAGVRVSLAWLLAVLLPLCINGNKQPHYLLMLTPPLMVLVGRFLASPPPRWMGWRNRITVGKAVVALLAGVAAPIVASQLRGQLLPTDWALAALLTGLPAAVLVVVRIRGIQPGVLWLVGCVCVVMPVLQGWWLPSLDRRTVRELAADINASFGQEPLAFYGSEISLPLCFQMRRAIPLIPVGESPDPGTVLIVSVKRNRPPPNPPPPPFTSRGRFESSNQTVEIYTAGPQP